MQSSSTSFCASFPHPPLVFIGLLKFLTWCHHGSDLPNAPCKKGEFSSCSSSLLSLSSKHSCLPFPSSTHWEFMWNYLPLLIPKFSATSLLFQNLGCRTVGLCWVCSFSSPGFAFGCVQTDPLSQLSQMLLGASYPGLLISNVSLSRCCLTSAFVANELEEASPSSPEPCMLPCSFPNTDQNYFMLNFPLLECTVCKILFVAMFLLKKINPNLKISKETKL